MPSEPTEPASAVLVTHPMTDKSYGPTRLVVATVLTAGDDPVPGGPPTIRIGTHVYSTYQRRRGDRWTVEAEPDCWPIDHWWQYISELTRRKSRLWIVGPRMDQFLPLTDFYLQVESGVFSLFTGPTGEQDYHPSGAPIGRQRGLAQVLSKRCTIVEAIGLHGRIFACSTNNWLDVTDYRVCLSTGVDCLSGPDPDDQTSEPPIHPREACTAWTRWTRGTILSWIGANIGNWQPTAAGLAVASWRRIEGPRAARKHPRDEVIELESGAMHGGRATSWFYGDCGDRNGCMPNPHPKPPKTRFDRLAGTVERYDARSLYPAIMRDEIFPVQLGGFHVNPDVKTVKAWCKHQCVIASVTLSTDRPEYPRRTEMGTDYPVGRWTTTLAGPELDWAFRDKAVVAIHAAARYLPGRPFATWSQTLIDLRDQCRADGDTLGVWLAKSVANALGGRFAMHQRRWFDRPTIVSPILWGEWTNLDADAQTVRRFRSTCGRTKELVIGKPGYRLLAAIYAYLTSYGRSRMRALREKLLPDTIVSQCTDSLWILRKNHTLQPSLSNDVGPLPGQLRQETSYHYSRLIDPNRYYADGRWILAGVPAGFWIDHRSQVCSLHDANPILRGSDERPRWIAQRVVTHPVAALPSHVSTDNRGWLLPCTAGLSDIYRPAPYSPGWQPTPAKQLYIPDWEESPHAD